ncbi:MAG TPA: hypothetical protein VEV43_07040 [Actinomycetota bacterium]|nr:hypothetical protein [Actinomycetota bacterium]
MNYEEFVPVMPEDDAMPKGLGRFPDEIDAVLSPLKERVRGLPTTVAGERRKFAHYLLLDAMSSAHAIELVVKSSRVLGTPPLADAIEPVVRHVVEKAIVIAYVARSNDERVVDRFLKTSAREWERSFGSAESHPHLDLPVKELPKYKPMAEAACPELVEVFAKLSWISHPRSALPFSMQAYASADVTQYAQLRVAKALGWLEEALAVVLDAHDVINEEEVDEPDTRPYFLSKNEFTRDQSL